MSAKGGIVHMPLRTEIASDSSVNSDGFGVVVSLHSERSPSGTTPGPGPTSRELGPISPELALIDPELARAARELLPDPPRPISSPVTVTPDTVTPDTVTPAPDTATFVERLRDTLEPIPDVAPHRRRLARGRLLLSGAGLLVLGAALTLFVRSDWRPLPLERPTEAPVTATSPPRSTPTGAPPATTVPAPATTATTPTKSATTPTKTATTPAKTAPPPARTATAPKTATVPSPRPTPVLGQTFAWVARPDAGAYEFQLFRGAKRIFRTRVVEPRLELPGRWRMGGRVYELEPGRNRWYVWPVSKATKRQSKVATVQATLVIGTRPR
jgi:hypothetical protein